MSSLLLSIVAIYAFVVGCWVFYIAVMGLKRVRHQLHPIAKVHAYMVLTVGMVVLEPLLNVLFSIALLDAPREWTVTKKLKRLKRGSGWRAERAFWICEHWLNQFDPGGDHC